MKHTFIFIDKLMILLKYVPSQTIDTEKDKNKLKKIIILLKEYMNILRKLLFNHRNEKYLTRLHQTHIKEIENWVEQVEATFNKMDSLLTVLDEDIKKLEHVLENESEDGKKYQHAVADMSMNMLMTGLHDEEEDMKRLKNIAVFEIHELEEIIDHKKHMNGLNEWLKFAELSYNEQIIRMEKYFAKLLS
jgi:hypothetical protein|tara:strand:+ start:232 stop:801 length:570 start_codon:yes stop_codon:yes gene_type:complete